MGTSIYDWSQTPIENEASDGEINWNENQDPGTVNNSARAMMARIRAHIADITPSRASMGSANIYAINIASAPSSLVDGLTVAFRAHQANTGSSILQVNSFGSIPLRSVSGSALHANEIMAGRPVVAAYNASINEWLIINGLPQLAQLYGDILTESDVQDIASAYVQANPDDVRAALWVMRPVASAVTTTPPSSATDGTLYLVPTGASSPWNTKAGLVAEAAAGSWTYHSPADGWSVCPKDTPGTVWLYINAAWTSIAAAGSTATNRKAMVVRYEQPNGTHGGAVTTGSRQTYPINAVVNGSATNFITGAALASNKISGLPVGVYDIIGSVFHYATNSFKLFLVNVTTATDVIVGVDSYAQNNSPVMASNAILVGSFEVTNSAHEYAIQYRAHSNGGPGSLGLSGSYSEGVEIYGQFQIVSAATERGSNGSTGAQGPGGAGYLASSATSLTIGTGTQTLTTSSGLAYRAGDWVQLYNAGGTMHGAVTSYSGTSMVVDVTATAGSGTYASWTISIAGQQGAAGTAGTNGVGYGGTSTTALEIGAGSKTWATQASLGYVVGSRIRWSSSTTAYMEGTVTDYTGTSMTLDVDRYGGSGTLGAWSAAVAGIPGAAGAGSGTVTSAGLSMPAEFSVSGSPVTGSGTLVVSKVAVGPGLVYAGPVSGASAQPAFRAIAADDLPVSGVTPGTYDSVTVDDAGNATAGSNPALTNGTFAPASVTVSGGKITGVAAGTAALPTFQRFTYPSDGGPQTWNKPSGCKAIRYQAVGGGGQGGGCTLAAGGVGPGGGAGAPAEGWLDVTSIASLTINIGKGGSAGAVAAAGEDGGMTSIANGATNIVTCPGGKGGPLNTSVTTAQVIAAFGGLGGGPVTGLAGSFFSANYGAAGGNSARTSAAILVSGAGASSPFGMGAPAKGGNSGVVNSTGGAGLGFGSGGSGCVQVDTTNNGTHKGGSGAPGLVIIEEFY
jgi:hypothetical protein